MMKELLIDLQLFAEGGQKDAEKGAESGKDGERRTTESDGKGGKSAETESKTGGSETAKAGKETSESLTKADVEKMIQSETDRVRTEYSKKVKALEAEAESLKKEKMTAEEKAKYEDDLRRKELEDKDRELTQKELRLKSYEIMREKDLPTGKEWQDMLLGGVVDETDLIKRVEAVHATLKKYRDEIRAEVYKEFGREPGKREESATGGKKYTAEILKRMSAEDINKNWEEISKQLEAGNIK